jgi:hypothetical protein
LADIRFGTVRVLDRVAWTADVELQGVFTLLLAVPLAYHVREDLVVDGARCVVVLDDVISARGAVVVALFSGRPASDPVFDPVLGHKHRGIDGDGPEL